MAVLIPIHKTVSVLRELTLGCYDNYVMHSGSCVLPAGPWPLPAAVRLVAGEWVGERGEQEGGRGGAGRWGGCGGGNLMRQT